MRKEEKLQLLNKLLNKAKEITSTSYLNPAFKEWKILVERTLIKLFGEESIEVNEFKRLKFYSLTVLFSVADQNAMQHVSAYNESFQTALKSIKQYIEEFKEETEDIFTEEKFDESALPKFYWQGTQKEL